MVVVGCSTADRPDDEETPDVLVSAIGANPPALNRYFSTDPGVDTAVSGTVYETLVVVNASYEPQPGLAESWDVSEDGLSYTFHLQEDVAWHDGEPFTSADVKFTFEELMPLSPLTPFTKQIESVETPDDSTVVVNFSTPYAPFLPALSGAAMVAEHVYTTDDLATDPANMSPIGTGPYKFTEFASGQRVTLTKNDDYWGGSNDAPDQVIFQIMPDANARLLAMQTGELGYLSGNFADRQFLDQLDETKVTELPSVMGSLAVYHTFFNTQNEYISDPAVRRAIFQAIDREALVERAFAGDAVPATGPIPSQFAELVTGKVNQNEELPFNPQLAGEALDKAGYPADASGHRFDLRLLFVSVYPPDGAMADIIVANLADVGISVALEGLDPQVYMAKVWQDSDFDLAMHGYATFTDPSIGVSRLYLCNPDRTVFRNASNLCDDELTESLTAAGITTDTAARAALFEAAEERALALMPTMPLLVEGGNDVYNSEVWKMADALETAPARWSLVAGN